MPIFRKKPVEIEAMRWTGYNKPEIKSFAGAACFFKGYELYIKTLEGDMKAMMDDYIIKGVNGEFYPCNPNIFAKTYELVSTA